MIVEHINDIKKIPVYNKEPVDGEHRWVDPHKIKFSDFFKQIFFFDPDHVQELKTKIEKRYDTAYPAVIWLETGKLLKGHHRVEACKQLNVPIYAIFQSFDKDKVLEELLDEEALHRDFSLDHQQFRTALTLYGSINCEKYASLRKKDSLKQESSPITLEDYKKLLHKKFQKISLGKTKIEKIVTILQNKDNFPDLINYILNTKNKKTISSVFKKIMESKEQVRESSDKKLKPPKVQLVKKGNEYATEYNFLTVSGEQNIINVNASLMQDKQYYKVVAYLEKNLPDFLEKAFRFVKLK